ncbi:hypothetical protein ACFY1A_48030 [Streptomyces sp. NPDC001520]
MTRPFDLLIRHAEVVDTDGEHGIADVGIAAVEPELSVAGAPSSTPMGSY